MLGPHYISQKPDEARANLLKIPRAFLKVRVGSITKIQQIFSHNTRPNCNFQKPSCLQAQLIQADRLKAKFVKPEPNLSPKLEPIPSAKIMSPLQLYIVELSNCGAISKKASTLHSQRIYINFLSPLALVSLLNGNLPEIDDTCSKQPTEEAGTDLSLSSINIRIHPSNSRSSTAIK